MSTSRRASSVAVACGLLTGCAASAGGASPTRPAGVDDAPPTTYLDAPAGPYPGPPAEVLDAQVVFFDPDGRGGPPGTGTREVITDVAGLEAFAARYVDDAPVLGADPRDALAAGMVLVGGTISIGCDGADRALLVNTGSEVHAVGVRPRPDHEVTCVRAVTSTALLAVTPDVLAAVRGAG